MSMALILVRVPEAIAGQLEKEPEALEGVLDDALPEGVDPDEDVHHTDFGMFVPYLEHVAATEGTDEWPESEAVKADPMCRALLGTRPLELDFGYGPVQLNTAEDVRSIVEEWTTDFSEEDLENGDRLDVAVYQFYLEAAQRQHTVFSIIC